MRIVLHAERRRTPRRAPAVAPRDLRRPRQSRRHGLRGRCAYLPSVCLF